MNDLPIEGNPTDDQKDRLEDWLIQLKILCRAYDILLDTEDGETRLIDLETMHVIGMGLSYITTEHHGETRITAYDITDSILDGVWPVHAPCGALVEQRTLGRTWVRRPDSERPR